MNWCFDMSECPDVTCVAVLRAHKCVDHGQAEMSYRHAVGYFRSRHLELLHENAGLFMPDGANLEVGIEELYREDFVAWFRMPELTAEIDAKAEGRVDAVKAARLRWGGAQ